MNRDTWYSLNIITYNGALAVEMAVNIVHTNMKKYRNPNEPPSLPAEKPAKKLSDVSFYDKVFELVRKVPKGKVTTYGAIAEASGIRLSARMVGWALHAAGNAKPKVPAHRVVNRVGLLSAKHQFATPTLMQELLEAEGIKIKDDKILNFKTVLWVPEKQQAKQ
jgi:methylated-DNA-protein-cysteine methyltransferase-like protein